MLTLKWKVIIIHQKKQSGRDSQGHVSVRHRGGEHKRFIRLIDWQVKDVVAR
jgi:ribosomal protein L2